MRRTGQRFRHGCVSRRLTPIMTRNVLHVVESSAPEAGTVAVLLDGLHEALRSKGMASGIIALNGTSPAAPGLIGRDPQQAPSDRQRDDARLVADADLLHFHGWGHPVARRLAVEARRARKPYVISPLGSLTRGGFRQRSLRKRMARRFGEGRVVRQAVALTTSSNFEAEELERMGAHANVRRISYGINSQAYASNGEIRAAAIAETSARSMLLLGPDEPKAGFVPLLRSLEELAGFTKGWRLIVAVRETGDWSAALKRIISEKGWTGRIRFCRAPDVSAQRELLAEASLLVAPDLRTCCPVSILQAAASGVPVIASAYMVPSVLEDVVCVFGTERVGMKIDLRRLLGLSDDQRSHMAERARTVVRNRVDWRTVVDEYVQFYRSLM